MNKFDEIFNKIISEEAKRKEEKPEIKISKVKSIIKEILTPKFHTVKSKPYGFDVTKVTIKNGDKQYEKNFKVECSMNENEFKSKGIDVTISEQEGNANSFKVKKHTEFAVSGLDEKTFESKMKTFLKF